MSVREEVRNFTDAGPLPSEDAEVRRIEAAQRLLELIPSPVTDEEAQLLSTAFGSDDCYGTAWTLLHLIETAPGARTAEYRRDAENEWVRRLNARVRAGVGQGRSAER